MELLFELFLTISLSLIFTSLFIKLFSMNNNHEMITDKRDVEVFAEEKLQLIKLQECKHDKCEPSTEGNDDDPKDVFGSKVNDDQSDEKLCEIEIESLEEDEEEDEDEEEEVVECEGEKDEEMIDDWEKIGRKDFEEILGKNNNKVGLHEFDVNFGKLYDFDLPLHGK